MASNDQQVESLPVTTTKGIAPGRKENMASNDQQVESLPVTTTNDIAPGRKEEVKEAATSDTPLFIEDESPCSTQDTLLEKRDGRNLGPERSNRWLVFALRFFLFSPIKWKVNGCWISVCHFVWFVVYIAKICYLTKLTFQVGHCRENVSSSIQDGYLALHHTLLKHWDASFETLPYPPSTGKFAVYNMDDLQKRINFAVENVFNAEVTATGYFKKLTDDFVKIRVVYFDLRKDYEKHSFKNVVTDIQNSFVPLYGLSNYTDDAGKTRFSYNITEELVAHNLSSVLDRMLSLNIMFSLHTLRVSKTYNDSRCLHIYGNVTFDDEEHNGQILVDLKTNTLPVKCAKMKFTLKDSPQCRDYHGHTARHVKYFSFVTIIGDILTFVGGIITLIRTYFYMKKHYPVIYGSVNGGKNLPWSEYLCNVKLWHIPSVIADIFTLLGVEWILTRLGDDNDFEQSLNQWDKHVVYLGSGCLLTWFSLLRFIKINNKFTLLFKTLKRSAVDIIFFLTCVTIIFVGFLSCTYIVLGPYHVKFQQLSTSAETLFSMINGDEIFTSFALLQEAYTGDDKRIWLFSRVIIYGYVTIFTVFALNLLIALFNSAYEVVKNSYEQQKEKNKDSVPNTLTYFMCRDFSESSGRCCKVTFDEKNSLSCCRMCTTRSVDCTCGVFSTLVHFMCCNIFAICCFYCKTRTTEDI